jgi:hypothetical protein
MSQHDATYPGKWHGRKYYFGYHSDLHVDPDDKDIGARSDANELAAMLKLTGADFAQTDSKGHPGYTSWFSHTPTASVAPGIVKDPLLEWRAATKKLGWPLHCAYSGIYDKAAGVKHPDWCIRDKDGKLVNSPGWYGPLDAGDRMCPRSPYVDELMIPQLFELIDRYDIDGFWIDGDLWAMETCYCDRCRQAFKEKTGIAEPPRDLSDPNWPAWWNFTRESFEAYVTHYCEAVHRHKAGVLVASNWFQGFRCPGEPKVTTDWISGDALGNGSEGFEGIDTLRLDTRFISTRGKPWDLMLWCFYGGMREPTTIKPVEMLQQQAATIVACGGNVQTCENPFIGARSGKLVEWRVRHLGKLAQFVKDRQALCQDTETIPQIAVLHSEHHFRSTQKSNNLFFAVDVAAARGAALGLIESQYGVDILDEWALLPCLTDFPVVVAPEQNDMSEEMAQALKKYVRDGGKLLVSGADAWQRFGGEFLGVGEGEPDANAIYYVPVQDECVPVKSAQWRLVDVTSAQSFGTLGKTPLLTEQLLPYPAAALNRAGKGVVAYIPFDVFREFDRTRYPLVRTFIQGVVRALSGPMDIEVTAPGCVDVVLRQKDDRLILHLINQADCKYYEIPWAGPVAVRMKLSEKPKKLYRAFEEGEITWKYANDEGMLKAEIPNVHIHAALVVEK